MSSGFAPELLGRTLEVTPNAILKEYREFYNAKGRYVGRFDNRGKKQEEKESKILNSLKKLIAKVVK